MYKKIRNHPSTLTIYGNQLVKEGVLRNEEFQEEKDNFKKFLDSEFETSKNYIPNQVDWFTGSWSKFTTEIGSDRRGVTGVDLDLIHEAGEKICKLPDNLNATSTTLLNMINSLTGSSTITNLNNLSSYSALNISNLQATSTTIFNKTNFSIHCKLT